MSFRVTIEEITPTAASADGLSTTADIPVLIKRYEQTVDVIDLRAVMAAVNARPRKPRARKEKGGSTAS